MINSLHQTIFIAFFLLFKIKFIRKNLKEQFIEINLEEFNEREGLEKVKYKLAKTLDQVQMRGFQKISDEGLRKYNSRFENF